MRKVAPIDRGSFRALCSMMLPAGYPWFLLYYHGVDQEWFMKQQVFACPFTSSSGLFHGEQYEMLCPR